MDLSWNDTQIMIHRLSRLKSHEKRINVKSAEIQTISIFELCTGDLCPNLALLLQLFEVFMAEHITLICI